MLLCTAVGLEGIGAAQIVHGWLPGTPEWAWVALFMVVFCGTNLAAVKNFGEFEFWFAALKVGAISLFLVLGVLALAGVLPGTESPGGSNLTELLPNGGEGLVIGLLASVFAYGGLETVTIAAAESQDPVRGVARAVRTAMWRIALFYVGSMAVVVALVPWDSPQVVEDGPYVAALDRLGIPGAYQLMNVVVLVALLSAMNANIYGASRIGYSLVERGQGPAWLGRVSGGVPRVAVLVSSVFGFLCVLLSYWRPDDVFAWLLNMIGAVILVVWIFIAVSQLRLRRRLERETPERLAVRMWAFPWLTWVALVKHGHGVRPHGEGTGHAGAALLHGRDDAGAGGGGLRLAANPRPSLRRRTRTDGPRVGTRGPSRGCGTHRSPGRRKERSPREVRTHGGFRCASFRVIVAQWRHSGR